MPHDLYGEPIKPLYWSDPDRQPELFSESGGTGSAWMRAAEEWSRETGLCITRWYADQRFVVRADRQDTTYRAQWLGDTWDISPTVA